MSKSIRESRIDAIKVIYSCHLTKAKAEDIMPTIIEDGDENAIRYALNVMSMIKEIDEIISNSLVGYTINSPILIIII